MLLNLRSDSRTLRNQCNRSSNWRACCQWWIGICPQTKCAKDQWNGPPTQRPPLARKASHYTFTALFLSANHPAKGPRNDHRRSYPLQMWFISSSACGTQQAHVSTMLHFWPRYARRRKASVDKVRCRRRPQSASQSVPALPLPSKTLNAL